METFNVLKSKAVAWFNESRIHRVAVYGFAAFFLFIAVAAIVR